MPKSGKRSLPDVQEEPHDERDEDFDMHDDRNDLYDLCKFVFVMAGVDRKQIHANTANPCLIRRRSKMLAWR